MVAIGDIVEVRSQPGQHWAVTGPDYSVGRTSWRLLSGRQSRLAADGEIIIVAHPHFDTGQRVVHRAMTPWWFATTAIPCASRFAL
jgi:hypothetical protein